jgi:hypothetical protein
MPIRIFLSATFVDLVRERLAVIDAFRRLRVVNELDVDLTTMEDFGFSTLPPIDLALGKLEECDGYLCLLGNRYGSIPQGRKQSFTHIEYEKAHELGLPIFVLEKSGAQSRAEIEQSPKNLKLLNELREHASLHHTVVTFNSVDELARVLTQFLPNQMLEKYPHVGAIGAKAIDKERVRYFQVDSLTQPLIYVRENPVSIDVTAVSGFGFLYYSHLLDQFLKAGCVIRLIILKEGGLAAKLISEIGGKAEIASAIRSSREKAHRIRESAKASGHSGELQVREIDWLPSATLFIVDRRGSNPVAWVGTYTPDFTSSSREKWFVELTPVGHLRALEFYVNQFERLWSRAEDCL